MVNEDNMSNALQGYSLGRMSVPEVVEEFADQVNDKIEKKIYLNLTKEATFTASNISFKVEEVFLPLITLALVNPDELLLEMDMRDFPTNWWFLCNKKIPKGKMLVLDTSVNPKDNPDGYELKKELIKYCLDNSSKCWKGLKWK